MLLFPDRFPEKPPLDPPLAFLRWLWWQQRGQIAIASLIAALNFALLAFTPYVLGLAIDTGLDDGLTPELWWYAALLLMLGLGTAAASSARHIAEVGCWMRGSFTATDLVGRHVSRTGANTTKKLSTGEVVATVATDAHHVGNLMESTPMTIGGLASYALVAWLMLRDSLQLGIAVLIGLPLVTAIVALLIPKLQERQQRHREATGRLTGLASDTVAGLRVLRGIGGEDEFTERYTRQSQKVRQAGVGVANTQSILTALQVLLPGLFAVGIVWFGAILAVNGELSVGKLVTFYGYTAFLAEPMRQMTMFIQFFTRATVAAKRFGAVLSTEPAAGALDEPDAPLGNGLDTSSRDAHTARHSDPRSPLNQRDTSVARSAAESKPWNPTLYDGELDLEITPGRLTVLVSEKPDTAVAALRRMGRVRDEDSQTVLIDGTPVTELPIADVRRTALFADSTPELFTGTLRGEVDIRDIDDEGAVRTALDVADAHDVLDSLGENLDGEIAERGRSLSGGQRQRVALARAILTASPILLLAEPTSAVDAHTEHRIAANLARHRAGRTTVIATTSPLVLDHSDEVVLLTDDGVTTRGSHKDLMAAAREGDPAARAYRRVVTRRDEEEADDAATSR